MQAAVSNLKWKSARTSIQNADRATGKAKRSATLQAVTPPKPAHHVIGMCFQERQLRYAGMGRSGIGKLEKRL